MVSFDVFPISYQYSALPKSSSRRILSSTSHEPRFWSPHHSLMSGSANSAWGRFCPAFLHKLKTTGCSSVCWTEGMKSEKRGFGTLSSQSDVSQWGRCWADVPARTASPTAPSVRLTEVDRPSLDLSVQPFSGPSSLIPQDKNSTTHVLELLENIV